jgi:8-amino-7-oxononanoate synthase
VASTREELVERLEAVARGEASPRTRIGTSHAPPRLAFLYPGQGAQRLGMLAGLRDRFPIVAASLVDSERALGDLLPVPLTHLMYPERRAHPVDADAARVALTDTASCQPAMHACGIALTRFLDSVGVRPDVVAGHSLGEFTAAAAAGVIDPGACARFVARRGQVMAALPGDPGAMAALMTDAETARRLLVDGAVVANLNHPRQTVVSGATSAVEAVMVRATAADVKAVRLEVSHAFHSPVLDALDLDPLGSDLPVSAPRVTVASAIADRPYASAADAASVFRRHATSPVHFVGALRQCAEAGVDVYLQVGAGGPLASFARGCLPATAKVLTLASTDDGDGGVSLLETLAQLWAWGAPVDVRSIAGAAPVASVPPSVLARESYWAVKDEAQLAPKRTGGARVVEAAVPPTPDPEPVAPSGDEVHDKVLGVVARVSAYPKDALRLGMSLQDDLGFDSLMVADLATGLADAFPGLGGIPQELLLNRPTVADMVAFARDGGAGGVSTADDDAPLGSYRLLWRAAPLPAFGSRPVPHGARVLVTGDATLATAVAARFGASGVEARVVSLAAAALADPVEAIVHCAEGIASQHAALLAVLARQDQLRARPDLLIASSGNTEPLTGVARAMAREWPDAVVKAVVFRTPGSSDERASVLVQEWLSADRTSEVRYANDGRSVPGLELVDPVPHEAFGAGETVLITGGTRGIGARLGARLVATGANVLLAGRGEPSPDAEAALGHGAILVRVDVTDRAALAAAIAPYGPVTAVVHAAGVLADGPVGEVPADAGARTWEVKVGGFVNAIAASGPSCRVAMGIGSWAGRFGNRHQAWYAAANATLAAMAEVGRPGLRVVVGEFGPWTSSEMVRTIPAPVAQAMRAEGVDFVADRAGLDAVLADLAGGNGVVVHGRDLPPILRTMRLEETLSLSTHPYLRDHAIDGTPVLPLAAAADHIAHASGLAPPFALSDLRLYQGITVQEPVRIVTTLRGDRAEIRVGDRQSLAYRARIRPWSEPVAEPPARTGGAAPTLSLGAFYAGVTFHGPMLQGLTAIDGVGEAFARGRVRTGRPTEWVPGSERERFAIDPLALDSAMQLCGYVAFVRYERAGTPVYLGRFLQVRPWPTRGEVAVEVGFGAIDGDRFTGTLWFRDERGLLAAAEDVVAELRRAPDALDFAIRPEWIDPGCWPALRDLEARLEMAKSVGIQNPYFSMHEGTARDTTRVGGRELVNFSSYNYLGLSGDPRVLDEVKLAIDRYGTSVSASRLASGERPFHGELERAVAAGQAQEAALVFTAGHATNVTTIGHLFGAADLVLHDELIHDSALQGIKLSGANRRAFKHDDPAHLEAQLVKLRRHHEKVLIVVEGVYSMDGDICDLPAYIAIKKRYGCMLMVDEAHSFGVCGATGQGLREHFDLDGRDVDLWMGTLSKSLASCGGWIAASTRLINYLRYTAPGFIYSAGLTPANGQAALSSLRWMLAEPWRVQTLQKNAKFYHDQLVARGVDTGPARGGSAVVPAVTGNSMHALILSQRLNEQGINVQPIVYPAVADDAARLRFFLSSTHSEEQLAWTAQRVADTLAAVRRDFKA